MVFICPSEYPAEKHSKYAEYFAAFHYELSHFQKYAIEAIVEGNHAITSAPTGSGKTLSAEFAIRHFVAQGKRVFYTTPIKALSNQKYYEFTNRYPDIQFGLLTGDIKTNPDADVVIMTAEILTNMLFMLTGADFPACAVVMDEVHYINDEHRGQTWEQTILMLPPHVQMIMLSATLDEPQKFANWVETCKPAHDPPKCVYLASTNHRIVPLSHFAYVAMTDSSLKLVKDKTLEQQIRQSTNRLIKIQTDKNFFLEPGVREVANVLTILENRDVHLKRKFVLNNLMTHLREKEMLPAICFVFSRKNVERCAEEITTNLLEDDSKVPYIMRRECEQIIRRLPNYREYLELPEYNTLVSLLEKGIGIHHSGMIPVLREIVELMISKKYIKLLFATESFSIGLDCPIRTAIFTQLKKYDGNGERYLYPHEYTQSAGRAGRRGIDTIGYVVHCNNLFPLPSLSQYKEILCGKPQTLVSKFHIQYSMVLRLLQNGQTENFHEFAAKSMLQYEIQRQIGAQTHVIAKTQTALDAKRPALSALRTPVEICREYLDLQTRIPMSVNKNRRKYERDLRAIQDAHRYVDDDSRIIREYDTMETQYSVERESLASLETYIADETRKICSIMESQGFISRGEPETQHQHQNQYQLTLLGRIAANIHEIHPLILAKCIANWSQFDRFSVFQIIAFLSVFTDVKVPEEVRVFEPRSRDTFVSHRLQELRDMYFQYEEMERDRGVYTGISYHDALSYDLMDDMLEWCQCTDEEQCKFFIQSLIVGEKEMSVGDFTKACLKISAVAKELLNVCEQMGFVEFAHKLTQIDGHLLKYIATTQSLYI
jgi:superfamily II RNA helicase